MADLEIMSPKHQLWEDFRIKLEGPEGCNFREEEDGEIHWTCKGGMDKSLARTILKNYEGIDVEGSLTYFEEHGGHCDCEILFNVM